MIQHDISCKVFPQISLKTNKKATPPKKTHFLFGCLTRKLWLLLTLAFNSDASQAPNIPLQCRPGSAFVLADLCITMPLLSCAFKLKMDSRNETIFSLSPLSVLRACSECNQPEFVTHKTDLCLQVLLAQDSSSFPCNNITTLTRSNAW